MRKHFFYLLILVFYCLPQPACSQRVDSIVVYFDFNRWEIAPGADSALHHLQPSGQDHSPPLGPDHSPVKGISLSGYCDNMGSDRYNDALSMRRALAVRRYLLRYLPASNIMGVRGFGKRRPLNENGTAAALDDLLRAMRDNPRLVIRIEGYVCCTPESLDGPDLDTRKPNLSVARARFVYDYLLQHGIDSARMSYIGFGGANKIHPLERDAMEQALNRRVEVRVTAK